jgi:hypothetical protein
MEKKATGLGVTEFFLRLIAWLCLKDDNYHNTQCVSPPVLIRSITITEQNRT